MVCEFTVGRERFATAEPILQPILSRLTQVRECCVDLIDADSEAYAAVLAANRLPRQSDDERQSRRIAQAAALERAIEVPRSIARLAREIAGLDTTIAAHGNPRLLSDAAVSVVLAAAAAEAAAINVRVNLGDEVDADVRDPLVAELESLVSETRTIAADVTRRTGVSGR
jgi:formiminotetrahydrofolate cyclodeaminase